MHRLPVKMIAKAIPALDELPDTDLEFRVLSAQEDNPYLIIIDDLVISMITRILDPLSFPALQACLRSSHTLDSFASHMP